MKNTLSATDRYQRDNDLMAKIHQGEDSTIGELVGHYYNMARKISRTFYISQIADLDHEDLAHIGVVHAMKNISKYDSRKGVEVCSYLGLIMRSGMSTEIRNKTRKIKRIKFYSLNDNPKIGEDMEYINILRNGSKDYDIVSILSKREEIGDLWKCINQLEGKAKIIINGLLNGKTVTEIAKEKSWEYAISIYYFRKAKKTLREKMEHHNT